MTAIEKLPDGDVRRLEGGHDEWRLRVGSWRVIFTINNKARLIIVLLVSGRGDAYKRR